MKDVKEYQDGLTMCHGQIEAEGWLTPCTPIDPIHKLEELSWRRVETVPLPDLDFAGLPVSAEAEYAARAGAAALQHWMRETEL